MDYGYVIIICFGMITASWTIIKIFGSSNIKRDVKDIKKMCVKMDNKLFGPNGDDGLATEFKLMQEKQVWNNKIAKAAHKRIDDRFGKDQDSVE